MAGARVAATCSERNADYVRALGAEHVIDYRKENVPAALRDWAPGGVDLVVDSVGQGTLIDVLPAMKRGGIICPIGTLIANEPRIDGAAAEAAGVTVAMRSKGEEKDYRLFPEPDLVPVEIDDAWISSVMAGLPELPQARRERFVRAYGIPAYDAGVLTSEKELAEYYERVVKLCDRPKIAANWIMGDVMKLLNEDKRPVRDCPLSPGHLAKLIGLIEEGVVSGKMAKEIIEDMYKTGSAPAEIIAEKGMVQITDEDELAETIAAVIADNPGQHAQYRSGKDKLFGYFVGQVMKRTAGKANPQLVNDLLKKALHHD